MKLSPEQVIVWYEIAVSTVFNKPEFSADRTRPRNKGDTSALRKAINDLLNAGAGGFELDRQLRAAGLPDSDEMEKLLRGKESYSS